jgi:hypothetical protein
MFGGPPWTVIGAIAIVAMTLGGARIGSLALMVPSLVWLGLSYSTGNRELYFPYTMYLAGCVALRIAPASRWIGPVGGAAIVAAFMVIRVLQQATVRVLAVEFVVAAVILACVVAARALGRRYPGNVVPVARDATIMVASSLLAYASLVL